MLPVCARPITHGEICRRANTLWHNGFTHRHRIDRRASTERPRFALAHCLPVSGSPTVTVLGYSHGGVANRTLWGT